MDYFQGVVTDYLRANRATFVNTECCIQLNPGANPDRSGPHWYCDALAVNIQRNEAYLCEISYSKTLSALTKRLSDWSTHWAALRDALGRDCGIPLSWSVRPWAFVPSELRSIVERQFSAIEQPGRMPRPRVIPLEDVMPWKYPSWNRAQTDGSDT
jgi:hypothetical protein